MTTTVILPLVFIAIVPYIAIYVQHKMIKNIITANDNQRNILNSIISTNAQLQHQVTELTGE